MNSNVYNDIMENVGIVIVTYNPNFVSFKKNFEYILQLNQEIIIVDNGSQDKVRRQLSSLANEKNVYFKELNDNKGIGYAQNIGLQFFSNKEFIFFLDQDSYIEKNKFCKLVVDFKHILLKDKNAVMIGPALEIAGQSLNSNVSGVERVDKLISSGSLITSEALKTVGFMKENYFIDFIDYEWCWRALRYGKHVYQDNNIIMKHQTDGVPRKNGHTIDPIFRLYYIFRNSTYILLHEKIPLRIKIKLFPRIFGKLLFQLSLENKRERLRTCTKGIYHGAISKF